MVACPFGIPNFEWDTPVPWIRKCTFCFDRQSGGLKPACVTTCPTGALLFGNRDELLTEAKARITSAPDRYVNHIYGEKEVGGTSMLYLATVPFLSLGFPELPEEAPADVSQEIMHMTPQVATTVATLLTATYLFTSRRQKLHARVVAKNVETGGK